MLRLESLYSIIFDNYRWALQQEPLRPLLQHLPPSPLLQDRVTAEEGTHLGSCPATRSAAATESKASALRERATATGTMSVRGILSVA